MKSKPKIREQIKMLYQIVREDFSLIWLLMIGIFLGVAGIGTLVVLLTKWWVFAPLFFIIAVFAPLFVLAKIGNKVGMKRIEGQTGAVGAILGSIGIGWEFNEEPVAVSQKTFDLVFRGTGRAGVVIVSEGPSGRVRPMLAKERKRMERLLPNVPIYSFEAGDGSGQIPLKKLKGKIAKLKVRLTKSELSEVRKRLKSVGAFKPPIPKGIDPFNAKAAMKGGRKAIRGK